MDKYKKILDSLLKAETEEEVNNIVENDAIFKNESNWKKYGDLDNNWGSVGNQQDEAAAALVEKLTNAIDALLLLKCRLENIEPTSDKAPKDIFSAAEQFFEIKRNKLHELPKDKLSSISKNIQLIATGLKGAEGCPSLSIVDFGEGQNPKNFPRTFLSLHKSNKSDINFVIGKFNMGGTGVIRYCGKRHAYQLLISKRCPNLKDSDNLWGFTLIRRQRPSGLTRNSIIQYFAPNGEVPVLQEKTLTLLPFCKGEFAEPYKLPMEWGTYIKLYEYQMKEKTDILLDLFVNLNRLLYRIPLPIRLVECREYGHHSPESNLMGMDQRLQSDRSELLDADFPASTFAKLGPLGKVEINYYLFKYGIDRRQLNRWVGREPIYFTINGQTHARLPAYFFKRESIKLDYLEDYLLVNIDCSDVSNDLGEDLFMPSRDRMAKGELREQIEQELERILKSHTGLTEKNELYRQNKVKDKIADETIKLDVLNNILSTNPMLARLFGQGIKLSDPSKRGVSHGEFQGKRFPTYFKIAKKHEGLLIKQCPIKGHCVVLFETDAQNDYLTRLDEPGKLIITNDKYIKNIFLFNGILHLEIYPNGDFAINDHIDFNVRLTSPNAIEGYFEENFRVVLTPEEEKHKKKRKRPEEPKTEGLAIPNIIKVKKEDWEDQWTGEDAIKINKTESTTDAWINVDNASLRRELDKDSKNSSIIEEQFIWGMVIAGLAIKETIDKSANNGEGDEIFKIATQSMARVILPVIRELGKLEEI
ncbi:MAG: hypothetical protein PHX20_01105 [Candidatus Omnitrophica bacterium]|nr:hypothetical protein [Candidatus Omnitrophota bacterium]